MAAAYEYWTAVFGVGLDGFSDFDHEELNAIANEGWEPVQLTAVHNGFATLVMFRRERATPRQRPGPPPRDSAPVKKTLARKSPTKMVPAKRPAAKKAAKKAR